jgi:hypothetical protein
MTIYDWAKPGVKVVCINTWINNMRDDGTSPFKDDVGPVEGQIYSIRDVGIIHPKYPNNVCVRLNEISNKVALFRGEKYETSFGIFRFRPLVTKPLPESLTCLLKRPKSVIVPDKFDYKKTWEPV